MQSAARLLIVRMKRGVSGRASRICSALQEAPSVNQGNVLLPQEDLRACAVGGPHVPLMDYIQELRSQMS